jgi:hypothetical protein
MISAFWFHVNFGFVHFWRIASLIRLESSQCKFIFGFMITSGFFIFGKLLIQFDCSRANEKWFLISWSLRVCSFLANCKSNSIGIEPMKSDFWFHDDFGFVHFWQIASLIRSESRQWKVVFDFMTTSGLFFFGKLLV